MTSSHWLRCAAVAALLPAIATGCTRVDAPHASGKHAWTRSGELRIGSTDEPDNLNPLFGHSDATDHIDALLFAPLFRYGPTGEFVPELATEVPTYENGGISKDSKTIVIHMRRGVMWSDGVPLTARDFRFTWRAALDPRNNTKLTTGWDDITAIDVPNDETAIVHLKRPDVDVLGSFGGGGGSAYPPLPEHLLGKLPSLNVAAFNAHPISSGPWLLSAWNHGSSLEFAPNPYYWRGAPKLSTLSWRIVPNPDTLVAELATHEIDVDPSVGEQQLDRLTTIDGLRIDKRLSASWRRLAIDCARPGLSDVRVRRAIAEGIDWNRINATVYHDANVRAHGDIPPDSWAAPNVPFFRYDPSDAARLVRAARGDKRLALTISATNKPGNEQAELQMQQALRAIGIDLTIKNYPASVLFAQDGPLYKGTYDLEWSIDTNAPDPDNQGSWSGDFTPPKGSNTSFLRDPIITQTSDAAIRTFDRAKRKALYQREESRIHEVIPVIFLYWQTRVAAYNSDLRGYRQAEYVTDNWNSWEWSI